METSLFRYSLARLMSGLLSLAVYTVIFSICMGANLSELISGFIPLLLWVFLFASVPVGLLILFSIFIDYLVSYLKSIVLKIALEIVLYSTFGFITGFILFLSDHNNLFLILSGQVVSFLYYLILKIIYVLEVKITNLLR